MKSFEWSNQMGSRGRASWLLLRKGDEVRVFKGEAISGWAVVRSTKFVKQGKWSHTIYDLMLADDVTAISGRQGWESNTFAEGLASVKRAKTPATWPEMATCLEASREAAETFLRSWKPLAAELLDKTEADLAALSSAEKSS